MTSGRIAGTLCIGDMRGRVFDELDVAIMSLLRDLVVGELEVRRMNF
jgi:hypothetical protein